MKLYRPGLWDEISRSIKEDKLARSMLFSGPRYSGRLSFAMDLAKELGVYDQVKKDGNFGNVSAKNCGSMVAKAIEIANRSVQ